MKTQPSWALFKTWLKFLLVVMPLPLIWALANPMFASPDEPSHIVRAQGLIRGDITSPFVTDGLPVDQINCMKFQMAVPADCMNLTWGPRGLVQESTTNNYPPLFHAVAGVPSLFSRGLFGAYVMRIWLVVICSSLFALAGALLWRRERHYWTLGGLVTALTPMVIFVSSTVNPSGVTTALAALIWASGISITRPTVGTRGITSRLTFMISSVLFPLLRRDAFVWEVLILLIIVSTMSGSRMNELKKDRLVVGSLLATSCVMLWSWFSWSGDATESFIANSVGQNEGSVGAGLGSLYIKILEMIGWFGWLDSPMTDASFIVLLCLLSLLLVVGVIAGEQVHARTIGITSAVLLLSPVAIGAIRYPYVQGRYLLPLWVGCMLLAGQALAASRLPEMFLKRLFNLSIGAMAVVQFFAFAQNLRRYSVGRTGTWKYFERSDWHPPMMSNLIALELAILAIVISFFGVRILLKTEPSPPVSE
jgi:hypothetical protein